MDANSASGEHFRSAAREQRDSEHRQHQHALQALQTELRQALDHLAAKNAELVQLNRDNGRMTEQLGQLQLRLRSSEEALKRDQVELRELRPLPDQLRSHVDSLARVRIAEADLEQDLADARERERILQAEVRTGEHERIRLLARLEVFEATLAQPKP
ncbi:MAG: hypothetical protein JSR34_01510 [Proteobacteria bacterium]|nr:hypothetical protein [Pseudomonadota bacterium]